jgi:PAS domain S-box-containing protein
MRNHQKDVIKYLKLAVQSAEKNDFSPVKDSIFLDEVGAQVNDLYERLNLNYFIDVQNVSGIKETNITLENIKNTVAYNSLAEKMMNFASLDFREKIDVNLYPGENLKMIATIANMMSEEMHSKVSELKEANMAMKSLTDAVDRSSLMLVSNIKGQILSVNKAYCNLCGYNEEELKSTVYNIVPPEYNSVEVTSAVQNSIEQHQHWRGEIKNRDRKGREFWIYISINPLSQNTDNSLSFLVIGNIVTERKQYEKKLIDNKNRLSIALEEKNILLQEVNHRVKNNLQFIVGLIQMQINSLDDSQTEVLFNLELRIRAIALVHEKMYRQDNVSSLNPAIFFNSLMDLFSEFYTASNRIVYESIISKKLSMSVSSLMNIGLLLNELISNSIKHAYNVGEKGDVNISIQENNKNLVLKISDSGSGIMSPVGAGSSLGMKLINALVFQLEATIKFHNRSGLTVEVIIPKLSSNE